jgi:hypothetical protein
MIKLPPGCTVNYPIRFLCKSLTDEMVEWFRMAGQTGEDIYWTRSGDHTRPWVSYGKAKRSSYTVDGTDCVRINFDGVDASAASMFLLKFMDDVVSHNFKEHDTLQY